MSTKPFCRRCLLEDMPSEAQLRNSIRELIDLLPDHLRAPDDDVSRRLSLCRECDHLTGGMCALCGCYVELRAANSIQRCPDVPARWLPCTERNEHHE